MSATIVERIADDNVGKIRIGKLDIDESPDVAAQLGIRGAPTVIVFKGGKESARHTGVTNKERLLAMISG